MVLSTSENHDWGKESPAINTTKHWRSMDDPQLNQKMGVKVKHVNASHYEGILITRSQIKRQETVNINHRGFSMPRTWLLNTMAPVSGCWRLSSTFQTSGQQCKWIGHNRGLCTPDFWAGGTNYSNPLIESHLSLHAGNMMWEKGWQKHYRDTEKAEVLLLQNSVIRRRGLQFHQCKRWEKALPLFSADIHRMLTKQLEKNLGRTWHQMYLKKKNQSFMEEENFPSPTHRGTMFSF